MWLRVAIFCGAAPLLAGVTLCGLFLTVAEDRSYESAWVSAGLVVIFSGLALFGLGLVALCAYFFKGRKAGLETRRLVENCILTLMLLFSNFPVAMACTWVANHEMSAYRLYLRNDSAESLKQLTLTWPGDRLVMQELGPGESAELQIRPSSEGEVLYSAMQGGERCEGVLIGYVSPGLGPESVAVTFFGGCEFKATER